MGNKTAHWLLYEKFLFIFFENVFLNHSGFLKKEIYNLSENSFFMERLYKW